MPQPSPTTAPHDPLASVLERNIEAVVRRRRADEAAKSRADRMADAVTRFTGSLKFVYIHLVLFGLWIVLNLPAVPFPKFDPTYVVLAMWASVEAIFLSTFVLITQNRTSELADKRDDLNLQISLLAEHEVTRLIQLVSAIAHRLEIKEAQNSELEELKRDVAPEKGARYDRPRGALVCSRTQRDVASEHSCWESRNSSCLGANSFEKAREAALLR